MWRLVQARISLDTSADNLTERQNRMTILLFGLSLILDVAGSCIISWYRGKHCKPSELRTTTHNARAIQYEIAG